MYPNPNPDQNQGGPQPTIPQIDEEMRRQPAGGRLSAALRFVVLLACAAALVLFLVNIVGYWR